MKIVGTTPRFASLTEPQVREALADEGENEIANEVARLIAGYIKNFMDHAAKIGRMPEAILRTKGKSPIERIAMELTTAQIRQSVAAAISDEDEADAVRIPASPEVEITMEWNRAAAVADLAQLGMAALTTFYTREKFSLKKHWEEELTTMMPGLELELMEQMLDCLDEFEERL